MKVVGGRKLRILGWDLENRPLSYLGQDFTTSEITAIGASWFGETKVHVWLLGPCTQREMIDGFMELWDASDMVTGHFIRNHDLPILQGARMELGLPPLSSKLTSDTKNDLRKRKGISAAQENLAEMLGLVEEKHHMNQVRWREANRLTARGLRQTERRVRSDVVQQKQLRMKLIEHGWLGAPRTWYP